MTQIAHVMAMVALLIAALGVGPRPLVAQRVTTITESSLCRSCDLVVTPVLQLGDPSGPGIIEHAEARVTRDHRGRMYVVGPYETRIKVFAPDGRYLRSIGATGSGPGEYQGIARVWVSTTDSLLLFDNMLSRYDVLTPEGGFVRSVHLDIPPEMQTVVLRSGDFVFAVPLHTPTRIGQPLHRLTSTGTIRNSFGSESGVYRPDVPLLDRRAIAPVGGAVLWSAFHNQYVLELLDAVTGNTLWRVTREAPWFPSRMQPVADKQGEFRAPEPMIMDVRQDGRGRLLVLIAVADKDWRDAVNEPTSANSHINVTDDHAYYDTVLEVLNPGLGLRLASHRFAEYVTHFVDDTTVATVTETTAGSPIVQVWDLKVVEK